MEGNRETSVYTWQLRWAGNFHVRPEKSPKKMIPNNKNPVKNSFWVTISSLLEGSVSWCLAEGMAPLKRNLLVDAGTYGSLGRSSYRALEGGLWTVGCMLLGNSKDATASQSWGAKHHAHNFGADSPTSLPTASLSCCPVQVWCSAYSPECCSW